MDEIPKAKELERIRKKNKRQAVIKVAGFVFVALVIVGVAMDLRKCGREKSMAIIPEGGAVENDIARLETVWTQPEPERIVDPLKGFSIVKIPAWNMEGRNEWTPYDLTFRGPYRLHLSILVSDVPYDSYEALLKKIKRKEIDMSIRMHIEEIDFLNRPAVQRITTLHASKVWIIDFIEGHTAHHLLFSAPVEYFDAYQPVIRKYLESYRTTVDR